MPLEQFLNLLINLYDGRGGDNAAGKELKTVKIALFYCINEIGLQKPKIRIMIQFIF